MNINRIILAAMLCSLTAMASIPAQAERSAYWYLQPREVFLEVYIYACEPVGYSFAGAKPELTEAGAKMYSELFVKQYASSCRDFYFEEISFFQRMIPPAPDHLLVSGN